MKYKSTRQQFVSIRTANFYTEISIYRLDIFRCAGKQIEINSHIRNF